MDSNKDGVVTKAEMIAWTEAVSTNAQMLSTVSLVARNQNHLKEIDNYFNKMDKNRNRRLSKSELIKGASKAGRTWG
jgi:Ca2+-binding EF-hand superfamily protein